LSLAGKELNFAFNKIQEFIPVIAAEEVGAGAEVIAYAADLICALFGRKGVGGNKTLFSVKGVNGGRGGACEKFGSGVSP